MGSKLEKLHTLFQAYNELKKEELEIVKSIREIHEAFSKKKNQLVNSNKVDFNQIKPQSYR